MKVYLDHAATTPLDKRVLQAMRPYLTSVFGNASSSHFFGREAARALDEARDKTALLFNASPSEVYFTSGGSEGDNWAVKGFAHALGKNCKQILLSAIEHHAMIHTADTLKAEGYDVKFIPVLPDGKIDLTSLKILLGIPTSLVCVMTANNETGVLQPIDKACALAHEHGAKFFTDAVQAAPYLPIDVKESGVDMLSISAHKFYGPKGMGALYIKKGVPMSAIIDGGEQERGLRGGTYNVAGAVGLQTALSLATAEQAENNEKIKAVRDHFIERVNSELPFALLNGDRADRIVSNANFSFTGYDGSVLLHRLDLKDIAVSSGSACASGSIEPSHVLTAMFQDENRAKSAIRFSFGKETTLKQTDYVVDTLKQILKS